jgi:hypothetical protein
MVLPKIGRDEILERAIASLEGRELEGADFLRRALSGEKDLETGVSITWTEEYQAEMANKVLKQIGHNPSETYGTGDFTTILYGIPMGLPEDKTDQLRSILIYPFINLVLEKLSANKVSTRNKELFRKVREKAYSDGKLESGTVMNSLANVVNENENKVYHIGNFGFSDGNYQYYLMEWKGDNQAVVCRKEIVDGRRPVGILMDFATDAEGVAERFIGIYSNATPKKEERFEDMLGIVAARNPDREIKEMLLETLDARLD